MRHRVVAATVAAAFSDERAASYAVKLITSSPEIDVRFTLRRVLSELDEVQMVILEASLTDPAQAERVETCMEGAHDSIIPAEVVAQAARAS
jgi:hypothetical protein